MTTTPQNPVDSVQVPQTVGLSPEVAFSIVGQAGLNPVFQVRQVPGQPLPGVATQWGQAPESFTGQPAAEGERPAQIVGQSPLAGTWVPRGSVLYMEWAQSGTEPKKGSPVPWIIAAVLSALFIVFLVVLAVTRNGDAEPESSTSPAQTQTQTATATATATETVTQRTTPEPPRTVTATATQTETATATATETQTATASPQAP